LVRASGAFACVRFWLTLHRRVRCKPVSGPGCHSLDPLAGVNNIGSMPKLLAAFVALLLTVAVVPTQAQTFELGSPPAAVVDMPRAWSPNETDNGVEANSPDGRVYVSVESAPAESDAELQRLIAATFDWLREQGVKLDPLQPAKTFPHQHYGDVTLGEVSGRDADGNPTSADIIVLMADPKTAVLALLWYGPGVEREHQETMIRLVQSIRPPRR
jgi:hypothetical protein